MDDAGITCTITGQSLIDKPVSPTNEENYNALRKWVNKSSVRFTNLEAAIVANRPGWPMKTEYLHTAEVGVLDLLQEYGFNLFSLSNNHAWDAGINGILDTIEQMEERSLPHAGTGRNLDEAQKPAYLETPNGTVALIAMAGGNLPRAVSQYPLQYPAYATPRQQSNRPGVNPLKIEDHYQLPESSFKRVKMTAEDLIKAGFPPKYYPDISVSDSSVTFLGTTFVRGTEFGLIRELDDYHRDRNLAMIKEAKKNADLVLVYLHEHHWENDMMKVGDWHQQFAKDCIDAGADCFVTHGVPKVLPVEIYDGSPIFYSLGNFIFHTSGRTDSWNLRSVAVRCNFQNGRCLEIEAKPIALIEPEKLSAGDLSGPHRNLPMATSQKEEEKILGRLKRISEPFGTEVSVEDGKGKILVD